MLIEVEKISCSVPGRRLFKGLSFQLDRGESLAIIGESGLGKSTLLAAIQGLRDVDSGNIVVAGVNLTKASSSERRRIRREHVGIVHQDGQLIEELTATENVAVALMLQRKPPKNSMDIAEDMLQSAGVPTQTLVSKLSGGERQRTALMRAMAPKPDIILADEPTGSLDEVTRDKMADELFTTVKEQGMALIVVTHDPTIAKRADRTISLADYQVK